MRKEQISDALNLLDDAILEETDRLRNREGKGLDTEGREESNREDSRTASSQKTGNREESSRDESRKASSQKAENREESNREDSRKASNRKEEIRGESNREDSRKACSQERESREESSWEAKCRRESRKSRKERAGSLWKGAAAAAGLLLAACAGWIIMEQKQNQTGEDSLLYASHDPEGKQEPDTKDTGETGLPMLSMAEIGEEEAAGYEGIRVHDISELVNTNPWDEALGISSLPVYENVLSYDENYIVQGGDFHKMREFLLEIAGSLGLEEESLTITDDVPDEETKQIITEKLEMGGDTVPEGYFNPTKLIGEAEGLKIEVNQAMTATVSFEPAVSLPEEYHFTHYAAYGEMAETAEYLQKEYADFIGMEHPVANIYGGGYNIYLQQSYWIEFYDRAEDMVQRIINYNFNRTAFYCDDQGKLYLARNFRPDLSRMVGEYPIITAEDAKELLRKGNYITTVPYEMPGEEFIGKVELVYRVGEREKYYMPYYRFYVELPEAAMDDGLKAYGAYYVPAVESAYISDMPVWDGSFNS